MRIICGSVTPPTPSAASAHTPTALTSSLSSPSMLAALRSRWGRVISFIAHCALLSVTGVDFPFHSQCEDWIHNLFLHRKMMTTSFLRMKSPRSTTQKTWSPGNTCWKFSSTASTPNGGTWHLATQHTGKISQCGRKALVLSLTSLSSFLITNSKPWLIQIHTLWSTT